MEVKEDKYETLEQWKYVDCGRHCVTDWLKYLNEKKIFFNDQYKKMACVSLNIKDFVLRRTIGTKASGRIVLATKKDDDTNFAIKIASKERLVMNGLIKQVLSEKKILQSIRFPFAIHLEMFFHDNSYLYFVMPFIQGGDLFSLLRYVKNFSEQEARFYSAQIILALEYLHYVGIVYRDLKPENLLLDQTGYIKIADFGFSKLLPETGRTYTFCGTIDYMSPEIIQEQGYGFSTDWWSLGVLIYEMCMGVSPFRKPTAIKIYENILIGEYEVPSHFSEELKDLLSKLLQRDVSRRIGCTWRGVTPIKEASWFNSIGWLEVVNKKLKPPYIPLVNNCMDDSLFDNFSNHKLIISPRDKYRTIFWGFCSK